MTINFITNRDDLVLSDDDEDDVGEEIKIGNSEKNEDSDAETSDEENILQLAAMATLKRRVFKWRKSDVSQFHRQFITRFSAPPEPILSPLQCFNIFISDNL